MDNENTTNIVVKNKNSKIWIIGLVAILVIAAVAVLLITNKSNNDKTIITTSTLKEVISINELSTGEFYYNGVVSVPKKKDPKKTDYSIKYNSTVKVGIDAKAIDFVIDEKNKTIKPILPEIKVNDVLVDAGSLSTIPESTSINIKDALELCKKDALAEANKKADLTTTAESNLKNTITALLKPLLKETGYTIVW